MGDSEYSTKDLGEAAALLTNQIPLLRVDRASDICWFVFTGDNKTQEYSHEYHFGELLTNSRDYYHALSRLKRLIHE